MVWRQKTFVEEQKLQNVNLQHIWRHFQSVTVKSRPCTFSGQSAILGIDVVYMAKHRCLAQHSCCETVSIVCFVTREHSSHSAWCNIPALTQSTTALLTAIPLEHPLPFQINCRWEKSWPTIERPNTSLSIRCIYALTDATRVGTISRVVARLPMFCCLKSSLESGVIYNLIHCFDDGFKS